MARPPDTSDESGAGGAGRGGGGSGGAGSGAAGAGSGDAGPGAPGDAARSSRLRRHPPLHTVGSDPDYRYTLANERTFLSWIRTALALLAAGVAVVQLAPDVGPRSLRLAVGVALIVVGGFLAGASHHRWVTRERAMRLGTALPRNRLAILLGYALATIAVAVLIVLLVSRPA